jgi:flagellin
MRLSSGLRINSAKDDAAGLAISQNMQGQINSVNQSVRNLSDATNLVQVADSSMATIQDMLLRIKQLATQGYDGSLSNAQKMNIVDEIAQLNTEINNTATRTKFNGNSLISVSSGYSTTGTFKPGALTADSGVSNIRTTGALVETYTFTDVTGRITLTGNTSGRSQAITLPAGVAGTTNRINFDQLGISFDLAASDAEANTVTGAAFAGKTFIVLGSNPSLDFQAGSDTGLDNLISYQTINIKTTVGDNSLVGMTDLGTSIATARGLGALSTTVQWANAFKDLGTKVDTAINTTSDERSKMGALMNRINYISTNLQSQSTNLQSSKSAIIDTDFAAETAKLTKGQIMQQAATAMLAQANQMPNVVLSLLK